MTDHAMADDPLAPCSDGGCILLLAPARGMHTNGGCAHLKLELVETRRLLRRVAADRRARAELQTAMTEDPTT